MGLEGCLVPVRAPAYDIGPTVTVGCTGKLLAREGSEGFCVNNVESKLCDELIRLLAVELCRLRRVAKCYQQIFSRF